MQIVENWSDVDAEVLRISDDESDQDYAYARILVNEARSVGSFPNLLANRIGSEISARIPKVAIERHSVTPGKRVELRIRQAGNDRYFVHPDF